MMHVKEVTFFSILIVATSSIQPNCEPDNQFRSYCFSIEFCNDYGCNEDDCGHFDLSTKLVKIKDAKIIPKCAFSNANNLQNIQGTNKNIQVIASGAFVNLPVLNSILFPFNFIRELHHGTFKNVTLSSLDLSWNRIIYIQQGAFEGISGLQYLNLSNNELLTIPVQRLSPSLINLNMSHNFLTAIALNYARFPNLTKIDFSNNKLERVALFFEKSVEEIDFTQNHLTDIDLFEVNNCERLKIPLNKFSSVPRFLKYANVRKIALYPNPWKCSELRKLWAYLQNNFIDIYDSPTQSRSPICSESVPISILSRVMDLRHCDDDSYCEDDEVCRGSQCRSPCKENACDSGSVCQIKSHKFECLCPGVQKRDPRAIYSMCRDVQCFLSRDCDLGQFCNATNMCQSLHFELPSESKPQETITTSPHYRSSDFYAIQRRPPPGSADYGASNEAVYNQSEPWWFYEIPKLSTPSDT